MAKNKNVTFIRKNGKVIPIKKKDADKSKMSKGSSSSNNMNAKKYGFYSGKSDRAKFKVKDYENKRKKFGVAGGAIGAVSGLLGGGKKRLAAGVIGGALGAIAGRFSALSKKDKGRMKSLRKMGAKYGKKSDSYAKKVKDWGNVETHKEYKQGLSGARRMTNTN